jgi:hypothetical protein
MRTWQTVVFDNADGEENGFILSTISRITERRPFFCWERPYRYFEEWIRSSLPPEGLEAKYFAPRFFRLVDETRPDPGSL